MEIKTKYEWPRVLLCGALLSVAALHKLVFAEFSAMPGGCDSRHLSYLMEHFWGWISGDPLHASFWDIPFFSPIPNVAAYSELMFSFAPLYWLWRALGLTPEAACVGWVYGVGMLNYLAAYYFLRKCLCASFAASVAGAFIMVYAQSHLRHFDHIQLYPFYYIVGALIAVFSYFGSLQRQEGANSHLKRRLWLALFVFCVVAQFHGCFYLAYFFCLGLGLALVFSLPLPGAWDAIRLSLRRDWLYLACGGLFGALALLPLAQHYLATMKLSGPRGLESVLLFLPRPYSWAFNRFAYLSGWMENVYPWSTLPGGTLNWEHSFGLGIATTLATLAVFIVKRRKTAYLLTALSGLGLMALTTVFFGKYTLWAYVWKYVPGASAMFAVARVGILMSIPAGMAMAALVDGASSTRLRAVAMALTLLCMSEQIVPVFVFDVNEKRRDVAEIASRVKPGAKAFVVTMNPMSGRVPKYNWVTYHINAMWASNLAGVPTVNGYSSNFPQIWRNGVEDIVTTTPDKRERFIHALRSWCAAWNLDTSEVQWIELK